MKIYVYANALDEPRPFNVPARTLDNAVIRVLDELKIDPATCDFDCISDHIQIVYAHNEMYVMSDTLQTTASIADIFH